MSTLAKYADASPRTHWYTSTASFMLFAPAHEPNADGKAAV